MYNELIEALRHKYEDVSMTDECRKCKYRYHESCDIWTLMYDAADAIERLVAEMDRKDKAIQGLLDAVDKKNTRIDLWKTAWKTAYKLYEATRESKGEQDGTEQNR